MLTKQTTLSADSDLSGGYRYPPFEQVEPGVHFSKDPKASRARKLFGTLFRGSFRGSFLGSRKVFLKALKNTPQPPNLVLVKSVFHYDIILSLLSYFLCKALAIYFALKVFWRMPFY